MAASLVKNAYLPPGHRLPRYTIVRRLSAGGFGAVYEARHDDGATVALKEFLPALIVCRTSEDQGRVRCQTPQDAQRFERGLRAFFNEADTVAKIRDPRVIAISDVFEANGTAYFAMPFEPGESLQRIIHRCRGVGLDDRTVQQLFGAVAAGIAALHAHGVLHLDIKPGNLWVRPDRSIVVLDLGAARQQSELRTLGPPVRTAGFAAPEQHRPFRQAVLTVQTDVYGIAASMAACVEGHPPRPAPERAALGDREVSLLRRWQGRRSGALLALIDQGLALDPAQRWPSADALKTALAHLPRLHPSTGRLTWRWGLAPSTKV